MSSGLGLRCRWKGECGLRFHTDGSVDGISAAASKRNLHEIETHNYHHQVVEMPQWSYTARLSRRGVTTINRK